MKFYFKKTIWEKVTVAEEQELPLLIAIKKGTVTSTNDIIDLGFNPHWVNDLDTEEFMDPIENDNQATIVIDENTTPSWKTKTIWDNSIKQEK